MLVPSRSSKLANNTRADLFQGEPHSITIGGTRADRPGARRLVRYGVWRLTSLHVHARLALLDRPPCAG